MIAETVPGFKLRPSQEYAIPKILEHFANGREVVIFHAPTGSGKSVDAGQVAKALGLRTFVTTPQRSLVYQYNSDPNFPLVAPKFATMIGKANFDCLRDRLEKQERGIAAPALPASEATCYEMDTAGNLVKNPDGGNYTCHFKRWTKNAPTILPECEYYLRKVHAELAPLSVVTLAFFLTGVGDSHLVNYAPAIGWLGGRLSTRPLLIVDEAHNLESETIRFLTSKWYEGKYASPAFEKAWEEWLASEPAKELLDNPKLEGAEAIGHLVNLLSPILLVETEDPEEQRFLDRLERDVDTIRTVADDIAAGIPWVVKLEEVENRRLDRVIPVLSVTPVIAAPHLKRRMWSRAEKILIMSGSFFGSVDTLKELGLDGYKASEVVVHSDFPAINGPVYMLPAAKVNFKNRETSFPEVLAALDRVLTVETGRGVVHTVSFANANAVLDAMSPANRNRLWVHRGGAGFDRDEFIDDFKTNSPPGSVLVSPSVTEGLDLPGELGEFAVFVKAPYANRSDERVARRLTMPDGMKWYERNAIQKTIQGRGRILRSRDDVGRTYVLDHAHTRLIEANWATLPTWFQDAIEAGRATLSPLARRWILFGDVEPARPGLSAL